VKHSAQHEERSMRSIQKLDRELNKKAKAQQKRQRKFERRRAAKAFPKPGATNDLPLQRREGANDR